MPETRRGVLTAVLVRESHRWRPWPARIQTSFRSLLNELEGRETFEAVRPIRT